MTHGHNWNNESHNFVAVWSHSHSVAKSNVFDDNKMKWHYIRCFFFTIVSDARLFNCRFVVIIQQTGLTFSKPLCTAYILKCSCLVGWSNPLLNVFFLKSCLPLFVLTVVVIIFFSSLFFCSFSMYSIAIWLSYLFILFIFFCCCCCWIFMKLTNMYA